MTSKGKNLTKKEIKQQKWKEQRKEQRTAAAEASSGAETLDLGATTTSGELLDMRWARVGVDLTGHPFALQCQVPARRLQNKQGGVALAAQVRRIQARRSAESLEALHHQRARRRRSPPLQTKG
jgi:hypothetical protein